jgi:hypothetical protein
MEPHENKNILYKKREMISKLKRLPTKWEKIFASLTSDKGLITRQYRGLKRRNRQMNRTEFLPNG